MNESIVKARKKALTLLTEKDRTTGELRDRLKKAGFEEEEVNDALDYVTSYGYLDDEKYARHYLDVMSGTRSLERIRFDLIAKGLTKEQISRAFEENGELDERPLIRRLAEKKIRTLKPDDPNSRVKLIRHLTGKGFHMADIIAVLEDLTRI